MYLSCRISTVESGRSRVAAYGPLPDREIMWGPSVIIQTFVPPDLANGPFFNRYSKSTRTSWIDFLRLESLHRCRSPEIKIWSRQDDLSCRSYLMSKIAADGNQAQNLETWSATWDNVPYIPERLISVDGFIGRRSGGPPAPESRFHMSNHQPPK